MNDPHITKRGVITTASTAAGVAAILLLNPAGLDLTQIQLLFWRFILEQLLRSRILRIERWHLRKSFVN